MQQNLDFSKAFSRGSGQIPDTLFSAGQTSKFRCQRNQTGMARLGFQIGKGVSQLGRHVIGYGEIVKNGERRYALAIGNRPGGEPLMVEYEPLSNTFYHTCLANGGMCYHLFELVGAMLLTLSPEFKEAFSKLDFSRPIADEENFFIACDTLYYEGKDRFNQATITSWDGLEDKKVVEDLFTLIKKGETSEFPYADSNGKKKSNKKTKSAKPVSYKIDMGRTLTPEEEQLVAINAAKVDGKELSDKAIPLLKQLQSGDVITSLFMGDAGTGKTTEARIIGRELGIPVYSQNYALNAEEAKIIGAFIPDEQNGGFKWQDGLFTQAFRNGGLYIAEEINFAKPGVLGIMNNALDGVGEVVLDNGEVIQCHPAFRFVAAINVGYSGTQRMNPALINRMQRVVKFSEMKKNDMVQAIILESGYTNQSVVERMVDCASLIKKKIKEEGVDGAVVSIRNLIAWAKDILVTNSILDSAWSTVVWPVCYEDEDFQKEIFEDILTPRFQGVSA